MNFITASRDAFDGGGTGYDSCGERDRAAVGDQYAGKRAGGLREFDWARLYDVFDFTAQCIVGWDDGNAADRYGNGGD